MTPRKIIAFALGPIGSALLALVTLPIITWLFSQEDVGRLAMLQVTIAFSTVMFSLGLDQAFVREFHEIDNTPALLKRALLPGLILLLSTLMLLLFLGGALADWLFGISDWYLSLLVMSVLLATFVSRFLSLVLRMNEHGLAFSISQILPKLFLLGIITGYFLLDVDKSLVNLIAAYTAAYVFVCAVLATNTRKEWSLGMRAPLDLERLKDMLRFSLPLVLGGLAYWGLTAVDKVFLRVYASYEELGVYSVAVSFAGAAAILQSVFSTVWAPTVYKWASKGDGLENVQKITRIILSFVVLLFCLAGLFSWIVTLFLPTNYMEVKWIVVSCLGSPLLYTLSEATKVGIGITRRSFFSMSAALISLILNIVGNWTLIPHFGASGAATSTCVSFWVFFVLRTEFSIFVWKKIPRVELYSFTGFSVIGACVSTLYGDLVFKYMIVYWGGLLTVAFVRFKNEIFDTITFFSLKSSESS